MLVRGPRRVKARQAWGSQALKFVTLAPAMISTDGSEMETTHFGSQQSWSGRHVETGVSSFK